ncbi:MAG: CatB-related O-acetyltransferase [Mycoplasmatales bacterium]
MWRRTNKHNFTYMGFASALRKISVGKFSYGVLNVYMFDDEIEFLKIGNFVSIASQVTFICGGNHQYDCISTFPFNSYLFKEGKDSSSKGPIIVEDDVWIGINSTILSGVTIGKGSIIAAGSVVTKDTKPFWIYGGNSAKPIKPRFEEKYIKELINFDYLKLENIK